MWGHLTVCSGVRCYLYTYGYSSLITLPPAPCRLWIHRSQIVKAAAKALCDVPEANCYYDLKTDSVKVGAVCLCLLLLEYRQLEGGRSASLYLAM